MDRGTLEGCSPWGHMGSCTMTCGYAQWEKNSKEVNQNIYLMMRMHVDELFEEKFEYLGCRAALIVELLCNRISILLIVLIKNISSIISLQT